jgi:starvation-inducible DNA-binding protein
MNKTNELLNQIQADATVFYQKTRAFHWTVTGRHFFQLHEQFEAIYIRWAEHIDAIAERTVVNGGMPLTTLASILSKATVREIDAPMDERAMIDAIVSDLRRLLDGVSQCASAAESEGNRGTVNVLEGIRDQEEKALWMLGAMIK